MPQEGGGRKNVGPYDKAIDENVLTRLREEENLERQYDINLESGARLEVDLGLGRGRLCEIEPLGRGVEDYTCLALCQSRDSEKDVRGTRG